MNPGSEVRYLSHGDLIYFYEQLKSYPTLYWNTLSSQAFIKRILFSDNHNSSHINKGIENQSSWGLYNIVSCLTWIKGIQTILTQNRNRKTRNRTRNWQTEPIGFGLGSSFLKTDISVLGSVLSKNKPNWPCLPIEMSKIYKCTRLLKDEYFLIFSIRQCWKITSI